MKLVPVKSQLPSIICDLRYSGANNITGHPLYESEFECQLDALVLEHLVQAAKILQAQQLQLVIWDAYRPAAVQQALRAVQDNPAFVAVDSLHVQGRAVDVTLAHDDGHYLDMGTDFDEFSPRAHADYDALSTEQFMNRRRLRQAMEAAGFIQWPYEWWHYNFGGS
ncbi:MAG TPA: M15 family metallopeptidase [Candidatus Saccharimonadales bacterium]|nr:M15 family metallopeptidase [Candidatus Saccharimonadales bacterium]